MSSPSAPPADQRSSDVGGGGGVHGEFGRSTIGDSRKNRHDPQVCNPRRLAGGDLEVKK
ncbi:MAG: hypothetical protein JO114_16760 [Planctomycetaceae bacterium]|nr:hypothetical protein [Planctomycetaceae bacterium]